MAQFITVQMEDGSEVYVQTVNVPKIPSPNKRLPCANGVAEHMRD